MARLLIGLSLVFAVTTLSSPERGSSKEPARCTVTLPHATPPRSASGFGPESFNYGTTKLRVHLWPNGILPAGELPGGGSYATIDAGGTIHAKIGWWRGVPGYLTLTGRRLDAPARRLRAHASGGYGRLGFQPSGLEFPTLGCWRVVGTVGATRLTFVVKVRKVGKRT